MNVKIKKELAQLIGLDKLIGFGLSESSWEYRRSQEVDLALLTRPQLAELEALVSEQVDRHGAEVAKGGVSARYYIQVWRRATNRAGQQKAQTASMMASFLKLLLDKVPGHRLYSKSGENWLAFYVSRIGFYPKKVVRDGVIPAAVSVSMAYEVFGVRTVVTLHKYEADVRGLTAPEFLARNGYYIESDELRSEYLRDLEKFSSLAPQVGLQLDVSGKATDDVDGNERKRDNWWYHSTKTYAVGTPEDPGRAVVDVFHEEEKDERRLREEDHVDPAFWRQRSVTSDEEEYVDADDPDGPEEMPEIPVHPFLAVFDLARHVRLRIHVRDVRVHEYVDLADKLVLPEHLKSLVELLIEHRAGGFQDIIRGKTGGATVLLAGPPGTGKTLTAEVYAESERRALYSVQCSQLGTDPDDLESELLKCFARCGRWNAVMLLDEADVYVHRRGDDLTQNAIVGVFLRVLEYQSAVLFLTTNRAEDVDDAVASRCVARLNYGTPSPEDQAKIWRILTDQSGAAMSDEAIRDVVRDNPSLTGRDVKNLLKLAMLMNKSRVVTAQTVERVKQFKPTLTEVR